MSSEELDDPVDEDDSQVDLDEITELVVELENRFCNIVCNFIVSLSFLVSRPSNVCSAASFVRLSPTASITSDQNT